MAKNIEIQINTGNNVYETIYPKTLGSLVSGIVNEAIISNSAKSLQVARGMYTGTCTYTSGQTFTLKLDFSQLYLSFLIIMKIVIFLKILVIMLVNLDILI